MGLIFASFCHETLKWRGVGPECAETLIHSETRFLYANRKSTSLENASQTYQPACKPGSVASRPSKEIRDGHSSGTSLDALEHLPGRRAGDALRCYRQIRTAASPSLFGFAPGVVCHAAPLPETRCALTAPFHPYLPPKRRRFVFCGAVPGVAPGGRYPPPFVDGARTFLPAAFRP